MGRQGVWECHFDNSEKPYAVKLVEILRPSDIEARKHFLREFDVYITLERAYQSGQLQDRVAMPLKAKTLTFLSSICTALLSMRGTL